MRKKISLVLLLLFSFSLMPYLVYAKNDKVVYLTFDDAPGDRVTEEVLDVLKENGVKGTFFVVGNRIKHREDILKRIINEGNGVGLHTYTHKMSKIYSSHKIFIDEMQKTSDEIYEVTGKRTHIIRFPGGSKPHLTKGFLEELHANNLKVYDWNVPVSDGINSKCSSSRFYDEGTNTRYFTSPIFILMHCSGENENTVKALPRIIEYYKFMGYRFEVITDDTPEYFFKIR